MKSLFGYAPGKLSGRRETLCVCAASTLVFGLCAHGYRYGSAAFSGDAALVSQAGEEAYQVSLGRFLQPVWWRVRGTVTAPFLIGLFSLVFLALSGYAIARLLRFQSRYAAVLACGVLTASETLGLSNATYLPWSDVYALSLLLALAGAYLSLRAKGWRRWLSALCYAASLALYQSYLACASCILVIALLSDLTGGAAPGEIWRRGALSVLHLFLGLLLYAALLRLLLSGLGIAASKDYNGVGRVSLLAPGELFGYLKEAFSTPIRFLFFPWDRKMIPWHVSAIPQALNLLPLLLSLFLAASGRRHSAASLATGAFLFFLLPLAMNFVMVVSKGVVNGLMIYAWYFLYLIPISLFENRSRSLSAHGAAGLFAGLAAAAYIFVNTVSCNTMYIKRDLEYAATHSALSRVLTRMEETQGYVSGETPVVIAGVLPSSQIAMARPGMEAISALQGMRYTYGASYETSTYWYLTTILGARVNLVPERERARLVRQTPQLEQMPRFPQEGCAAMIGGRLFLRLN